VFTMKMFKIHSQRKVFAAATRLRDVDAAMAKVAAAK